MNTKIRILNKVHKNYLFKYKKQLTPYQGGQTFRLLNTYNGSFSQRLIEVGNAWVGGENNYVWRRLNL